MNWRYHQPKNARRMTELATNGGFKDTFMFEKLVLDFELHYHMMSRISTVVRGGMGALLYAREPHQRLSEDIDVMTPLPKHVVVKTIEEINAGLDEIEFMPTRSSPRIRSNLVQYKIKCPSAFHPSCNVYMDFLCDVDPRIIQYAQVLKSPGVASLNLSHDVSVLARGALIADKMCTMASPDTIGLKHMHDFPKQIYDISALLRGASLDDVKTLFPAHLHIIGFMSRIYDKYHTVHDIIGGAPDTCAQLLDFGSKLFVAPEYRTSHEAFQSHYLKQSQRRTLYCHLDEILQVTLCAAHLREYAADADADRHAGELHAAISEYNRLASEREGAMPAEPATLERLAALRPALGGRRLELTRAQWHLLAEVFGDGRVSPGAVRA